jgi:ferredoxin
MSLLDEFVVALDVWEEARPYLHMMFDEREMQLVVAVGGEGVGAQETAHLLGMDQEQAANFLHACYARHVLDKAVEKGRPVYTAAGFSARLNHFAMFENWDDIPAPNRQIINRRFLDEFIAKHRQDVELKMQGLSAENALPNDTVMLLSEIEEMLEAATHIVVRPCDCRRLGQNCDRPIEVCIGMNDVALNALDRGAGRWVSGEEAKEIVRRADKKGLMHTADSEWRERGLRAICNCCACDCYPFRAAGELGSKGVWPKSRYLARHDEAACNLCGACVKRCHFDAFYHDGTALEIDGKKKQNVLFDPDKCWGCGLCANTCPSDAIVMEIIKDL